ncbi:hypothetical protein [Salmonella sp. s54412]|uniref:hypothetical protein n=1 Tax=Salmonella sp. s54412 TaxID=3160128 RepID=UPI0037540014
MFREILEIKVVKGFRGPKDHEDKVVWPESKEKEENLVKQVNWAILDKMDKMDERDNLV